MYIQRLCNPYLRIEVSVLDDKSFAEIYGAGTKAVCHGPHWVVLPEYIWIRIQAAVNGHEGCYKYLGTFAHEIAHALDQDEVTEQPLISSKYPEKIWASLSPYTKAKVRDYPRFMWGFEAFGWLMNDKPKLAEFLVGSFYDPEPRSDYRAWLIEALEMIVQ